MRKFLSIILTAAMTLSLFAAIPLGASAEASGSAITFDTPAETVYYDGSGKNSSGAPKETGTDQGKAYKFETIPGQWDQGDWFWPSALRLAQKNTDGTVSSFKVTPGKIYNISFKYKNEDYIDQGDANSWAKIFVKLLYVNSGNGMGSFLHNMVPDNWWQRDDLDEFERDATNGWVQYSKTFTASWNAPVDSEVALVLCLGNTRQNVGFWVDDVLIQEVGRLKGTWVDDFETEEQRTYYGDKNTSKSSVTVGKPTGETNYAAKYSTLITENNNGSAWNDNLRISMPYPDVTRGPVIVEAGEKYNISFKVKAETLYYSISKFYLCYASRDQGEYPLGGNTAPMDYPHKETIINYYTIEEMKADWVSFSYDFTVPADIGGYDQLALFPVVYDETQTAKDWKFDNQAVWIDDVSITRKTSVTVHNDSLGDFTFSPAHGININEAKLPFPNVKVVNWYTDAERTQIFNGTVTYDTPELWVDIENIVGDFENGYDAAKDGWNGNTFYTEQYAGTINSTALTNKGQAQKDIDNSSYSPIIKLINSDGSDFHTVKGHIYKLSFDMKPVDRSNLSPTGVVAVMNKDHSDGKTLPCYSLMNQETFEEISAQTNISAAFSNADDYYRTFEFTFDGANCNVYITPWCAGTAVYFDNINIIDLTAQLNVIDSEGNVLASGLDGETVTIHDPVAADPDFVYYAENGAPVSTTVVRKDKALTKVNSQIAVTGSTFDRNNSTVSFTTRFGGIGYTTGANNVVTVKTITVEKTRYLVEDIGLLVAPTNKVTGELTLDNLGNAIQISGTNLKYSAKGTDELQVTAQITTSKYDREYTVVGYVKCAGGKVIYSKTRNSIAKSYNAAAGIESVDNGAHIRTFGSANYKLVSNSEFNSAESLSNGWHPWGQVSKKDLEDAKGNILQKDYYHYYSVESATYVKDDNLVLDLKRTGETTYDLPELLSTYDFTSGYLEVRAKLANPEDYSCSIWLNSVAVPAKDLTHGPNETDIYVWPEIDIMESFKPGSFSFTLHNWGTHPEKGFGQKEQMRLNDKITNANETVLDLAQKYRIYGFERTPEVMRMYVDGELHYELTLQEAFNYRANGDYRFADKTDGEIKALFENPTYLILGAGGARYLGLNESAISNIDYVRFYQ